MAATGVHRTGVDPIRLEEAPGEADGPQLEAAHRQGLTSLADEHLGAASADVDEQQPPIEDGDRLQDTELDEAGFLHPGDDLDLDPGLVAGPVDEHLGVLGLTHRAGGHRRDRGGGFDGHLGEAVAVSWSRQR